MGMKKELGFWEVFSIAAGAMISSGLFVLPAVVYTKAGNGIIFAYFFAGLLMLPSLFASLELATAIPRAGGAYFFNERILGSPAGVFAGFANWFSISLKGAFALIGIGAFAVLLFPGFTDVHMKIVASIACVVFYVSNVFSVKTSGRLQVIFVIILLIILIQYVIIGRQVIPSFEVYSELAQPQWKYILATTGMVFISYGGLTKIASISEEVKNPEKNLVRGAIAAFVVVQILYLLVIFILVGLLNKADWADTITPLSTAALKFVPESPLSLFQYILTAVAAMLAFITTANASIMAASRSPLGMSRDGLVPPLIGKMNTKTNTPVVSISVTVLFMLLMIIFLDLENLAKVASLFMLLLFTMNNISLIVIRQSGLSHYKPAFRVPGYPVTPVLGIIAYLFLISQMGWLTLAIAGVFIVLTVLWFLFYSRKRVSRKSAFIHMMENVTNPELIEDEKELENELLDILMQRDDIIEDRFDALIRQAPVLDYEKTISRESLFGDIAKAISEKWGIPEHTVLHKLEMREKESQTLIYPGVAVPHAIPHIIIEGDRKFDIVLVRNKEGIIWNDKQEKVYTAFCLIGSKDERNFHLQALMAIAQVLQNPVFHAEWMAARSEKDLRAVVLLSHRKRV